MTGSSFTVVAQGAGSADLEPNPFRRAERRTLDRRLRDAALAEVLAARGRFAGGYASAVAVLVGFEWLQGGFVSFAWSLAALALAAVGAVAAWPTWQKRWPVRDSCRTCRWLTGGVAIMIVTLAIAPWTLPQTPEAGAPYLLALVLACFGLTASFLLAPIKALAAGALLLPLSSALECLSSNGDADRTSLAAAGFCAAGLVALVAISQHRCWRDAARTSLEQEDRIRALEAARDAAIKADQEKSRFLAVASHDLRQPVHAIGLFAATLEKRLEGSAEAPLVRNLTRAIDGLDRSFGAMLDISRLDAGAIEPRVQHFPLRDLFRRLHMHFAGQAEEKGLGLRFSPGGKSISSDPQLLERVLGNLVQNAIKYTDEGGIVVVARSTESHIHVEIWDTGVGIRAADLRKVFDEFYQVGGGQRVRAQGLGMGLAIVKRLVRLLGHELTVSSRPGKGTMFRLRIALGGLPDIQDVTAAADTLPMPILQPRTVLVLDDEEPIREGLRLLLQEWGYEAIAAGSIEEAIRDVARLEVPPDLILSDLHLGDGPDGIAGIEAIRRQCGCEVTAILITGDTSHAEIRRATESGHPVLFKPVQPRKLYDALRGLAS